MDKRKVKNRFCILVISSFLIFGALNSQVVIPVAGGNAKGEGGSMSYTIGQLINSASGGFLLHGVQYPLEVFIVSSLNDNGVEWLFQVYPNPATDRLVLHAPSNSGLETLFYQLFDLKGTVLVTEKLKETQLNIPLNNYLPSTYFLKVYRTNGGSSVQELKVFKIIKK